MTQHGLWIIGYGSLIFKPPPSYAFRVIGTINGYLRRFWQSSSDHRGTPLFPGRVVTLVSLDDLKENDSFHDDVLKYEMLSRDSKFVHCLEDSDLVVWAVAYYIEPENVEYVTKNMEIREQDGYTLHNVRFIVHEVPTDSPVADAALHMIPREADGKICIISTVYIGTINNESFVGPEKIEDTAKVIKASKGPSGRNIEYLRLLTEAVRLLDKKKDSADPYLEELLRLSE